MKHETYVCLREALDRLAQLESMVRDMPFAASMAHRVRDRVEAALKAEKEAEGTK